MANTVTRYQPGTGVTRLPDMVDRLFRESFVMPSAFNDFWGGTARPGLPANLFETEESYVLQVGLPGLNPENVEIQVMGRELSIKGRFETWVPEKGNWIWQGLPSGEFYEKFTLPVEVERDHADAAYNHGILSITLPKTEYAKPKSIKVSVHQ